MDKNEEDEKLRKKGLKIDNWELYKQHEDFRGTVLFLILTLILFVFISVPLLMVG